MEEVRKCPWCKNIGIDSNLIELPTQWRCSHEQCWYTESKKIHMMTVEEANMPYHVYLRK